MLRSILQAVFTLVLVCGFANAQSDGSQNVIDIVDYRFNTIRDDLNNDIGKIKSELNKIKEVQNNTIEKEIGNIDRYIIELENKLLQSIADREAFEKEFQEDVKKYNTLVVRQDNKIDSISSSIAFWAFFAVLLAVVLSFVIAKQYAKKIREDAVKEVDDMFNRWIMQRKTDEYLDSENQKNENDELSEKLDYWKNKYHELKNDDEKLLEEFKKWSKNIDDKKMKNKVKKHIKKITKEDQ